MASLRRSKPFTPDAQTVRFLYTILKQLDLKSVDWNEVAYSLDITNGHAARMRYSRFKQQIEGIPSQPRAPRPKKNTDKSSVEKSRPKKESGYNLTKKDSIKFENMQEENRVKMEDSHRFNTSVGLPTTYTHSDIAGMSIKSGSYNSLAPRAVQPGMPTMPFYFMSAPTTPAQVYAAAAAADNASHYPIVPARPTMTMADLRNTKASTTSYNNDFTYLPPRPLSTTYMHPHESINSLPQQTQGCSYGQVMQYGTSNYDVSQTSLAAQPQYVQASDDNPIDHDRLSDDFCARAGMHVNTEAPKELGSNINSIIIEDDLAINVKSEDSEFA